MTSPHFDHSPHPSNPLSEASPSNPQAMADSPSADSSFSDAYKEEPQEEQTEAQVSVDQTSDVSDDYAMTFDSDGDAHTHSPAVSQTNIKPEQMSSPGQITTPDASAMSLDTANDVAHVGHCALPTPPIPSSIQPQITDPVEAADGSTTQIPVNETPTTSHKYEDIVSGEIDIQQLLDNITANATEKSEQLAATTTLFNLSSATPTSQGPLVTHASLPPRPNVPPPRLKDDFPRYKTNSSGLQPATSSYRPAGSTTALIAAGAPGTSTDPRAGLPPPPTALFAAGAPGTSTDPRGGLTSPPTVSFPPPGPPPSVTNPTNPNSQSSNGKLTTSDHQSHHLDTKEDTDGLDAKWGPAIQKLYDAFIDSERGYVTEGLWDRFPVGSRLFIGNLPSEMVTKRDIFHVFHPYGKIAQISIKQAYGFVQFHEASACYRALAKEQGVEVRGKKIHLEVSKPQKNTRNAGNSGQAPLRRSKSPDYARGPTPDRGGRRAPDRNVDRFDGRAKPTMQQDEYGRPIRVRDEFRPRDITPPRSRQVTPPRGYNHNRDSYPPRNRNSYDGRDRRRSRSPSYGYRDEGRYPDEERYRERSLSPRAREALEDEELQLPRRDPRAIPDVQIILMDSLDRAFVNWVENEMRSRGVKVEVMFLSPGLLLHAVIRRQVLEGVHAVSKLDMRSQNMSKIPLQVFDRQAGANNVRFDEYQDLDPNVAAELVLRAKQAVQPQPYVPPQYGAPQYGARQYSAPQQSYLPPAPATAAPNLANLVGQLDNATLQKLLGTLNLPQQQNGPAVAANSQIDLAGLLGGFAQQQPQAPHQSYQAPPVDPYKSLAGNTALASLLGNVAPVTPPVQNQSHPGQSAQQVQNIMAQLARFRQ